MTRPRQDLLDADNEAVAGARGSEVVLFALAVVPSGGLCVYCNGLLEPLEALDVGAVKAALGRIYARAAEHAAAADTVERVQSEVPTSEDARRMMQIQDFVDGQNRPGRPGEFR